MSSDSQYVVGPADRTTLLQGPLGAVLMLGTERTGGRFSVVEHPLAPRALGSPVHTHRNEDEYSVVLEGVVGAEVGGQVIEAGPGVVLVKPRGVPHAFWNPADEPARLLEIISPAGFEQYFADLAEIFAIPGAPIRSGWRPLQTITASISIYRRYPGWLLPSGFRSHRRTKIEASLRIAGGSMTF